VALVLCAAFLAVPQGNVYAMPFIAAVPYAVGDTPRSVAVGDFNSDNKTDLAVANQVDNDVSILIGVGDGTFNVAVPYGAGTSPSSVAVGDFDGDGNLDLAVANNASGDVSILIGVGDGTFIAAVNYPVGTSPLSVAVGDFNSDNKTDLAVAIYGTDDVSILIGVGDGTFIAAVPYAVGSGPLSVAVGDFNSDNKTDLAVAIYGTDDVSILLGVGDGTFIAAVPYAVGTGPYSVAVGDFNSDNKTDLAVANQVDNDVSILIGVGDGTFNVAVPYAVGTSPASVAVGDFNGDGNRDLAVANNGSGDVSIPLGYGDGTFSAAVPYAVGVGPISVAVGDFTGDGNLDLAVANIFPNNVSILLNTSPTPPTFVSAATDAAGATITITFSKTMTDPAGKQAEFSYKVNGGLDQSFSTAALTTDNTTIDLTCAGTAIVYGDIVTVSYIKGTVLSADGNVLASFTDQPVTNNMPAPPVVVSAATDTTGATITITFSKSMADPAGKQAEFSYKVNGGLDQSFSAAALNTNNTRIDLTCSGTAIAYGDIVTVSYAKGTVLAADGGILQSVTDQLVTNNMPVPAPTFVSASTNVTGTTITVTFSKNMADPAGKQAEFSYKVNGGLAQSFSAAALNTDNAKIDLTCSGTAIAYGDNVTVSYTKGTVLAADGGILESFTDQAVTNNVPVPAPTFVSASTNVTGTTITVTFSKNMADPAGKQGEFSYKVNGGLAQSFSAAALHTDNTRIDLTCSGTVIIYGDIVTVSYAKGTVLAADGGILESFTDQAVTNNLPGPPVFVSAATDAAGATITITFSKNMADPAGKQAEFSYKVNGGLDQSFSAAALNTNNARIDLTCSGTAIIYGDTVTVSYTKGTVLAADGGILESFTDQTVINNMPGPPVFVSAATDATGATIIITFSKSMANPSGKQAEFSYKVNGGPDQSFSPAALNTDNTRIDLTCSGTIIIYGDTVTVSYTKGTVLAADGGILESFTDQTVTNNTATSGGQTLLPPVARGVSPTLHNWLKPAQMSLLYLNVNPQQASANQPVTIITNVVNSGDEAGNYNIALEIDGQVEQTKTVSVGPQGTQPVKFTVTRAQPGTYAIDIGGQTGSFTIIGAGGSAGAPLNGVLTAVLVIGVLILVAGVVLILKFRRAAQKRKAAPEDTVQISK
jgi:uncharacterized repeat protein (TIGR02059 family)